MKTLLTLFALALSLNTESLAQRLTQQLLTDWKFSKQDVAVNADDSAWERISLPHTWNAFDAQDGKAAQPELKDGYYRGACWYAHQLDAPEAWKGKRVFLRFEAASMVTKVYLNGNLVGEHRGSFTAFCFELTSKIHLGTTNELRVQVDNSFQEAVPPLSGDFNIFGGIYRPVSLIVTDPICITPLDFASPGVYCNLRHLSDEEALVGIQTMVSSDSAAALPIEVETEIKDAGGRTVATAKSPLKASPRQTQPVTQILRILAPHRWNGRADPYLYTATVHILRDGVVVDEVTQPLGLRTIEITQESGFLLNGKSYPLHGVNRHQDWKDKGWAISPAEHEKDLKLIEEVGATAIRLAHYPQSEYFYDLCDRAGMLLWNEVSLVNEVRETEAFNANAEQQLREMIMQRYNHPAVAFWGLFNELNVPNGKAALPLLHRLNAVVHELDCSRPTVLAVASGGVHQEANRIADWPAFNDYPGWYADHPQMKGAGSPDQMSAFLEDHVQEMEGRRFAISEYGAGGNPNQHEEGTLKKPEPKGQWHPEEWQNYVHERDWALLKNDPNLWGTFLWVMFDFAADRRNEGGTPGINDKGLVTQDRKLKKDVFYFYKANWSEEPFVHITSRRMTPRKLAVTEVKVYSDCDGVELQVNGKSLGKKTPDEVRVFRWESVQLSPGNNKVEATATSHGTELHDECDWTLEENPPTPAPH